MNTRTGEFWSGVRAELPILVGTIPFGLIYGVSALSQRISAVFAQAMSGIIFAGSSQFVVAQLINATVPVAIIVVTGVIINLRHILYSASLAPYTRHLPRRWKVVLAYLLTDEAYAVTILHYRTPGDATHRHWYFLGAGLALWMTWQLSTAAGVFLGAKIPAAWSLDFTLSLTFIAFVIPVLKDRASIIAALVAGVGAVAAYQLPLHLGLLVATALGIVAGVGIQRMRKAE